ncbi:MAG: DUF3106 domain-containing protein [Candidatus Binatia bacterium]
MLLRAFRLLAASCLLSVGAAIAQDGASGDERRWLAEHPEAIGALGEMPREELGQFLDTYRNLPPEEQRKLREHAEELQALSPEERAWALENPDTVRELGSVPEAQRRQMMESYRQLPPEMQRSLREGTRR